MTLGPLMVGVAGAALTSGERERLAHPAVGGVLLFARNYQSPQQLRDLVAAIHDLREPPLLVAVDQEGGRVQRFRDGFTRLPPMGALGRWYDVDAATAVSAAEWVGWLTAAELQWVGVDFTFAPVLDIDHGVSEIIGDRAFHHQADGVSRLAQAWQRGVAATGMATVGKHFPGHGGCAADSHVAYPSDERDLATLEQADLRPFRDLVAAGLTGIMPAHVVYPAVSETPVGFSDRWIREYLRGVIGFDGPVISDDLGMRAADTAGTLADRVHASLGAGCDMAILANEGAAADDVMAALGASPEGASARRERLRPGAPYHAADFVTSNAYRDAQRWVARLADWAP
jgi:beta-N-acetylhexosaminidase